MLFDKNGHTVRSTYKTEWSHSLKACFEEMAPSCFETPASAGYDHFLWKIIHIALLCRLAYAGKAALERLENGVCYWTIKK